jgi:O-antigen/teichoic acid export membrane protein
LIAINMAIMLHSHATIIGIFLPIASVALFALAGNLNQYLKDGMGYAVIVFYPAVTSLHANRDLAGLRRLFLLGSYFLLLVTVVLAVIAAVWAEDFFELWVGGEALGDHGVSSVVFIFRVLLIATIMEYASGTAGQIMLGSGRVKLACLLAFCQAFVTLALCLILVQIYGLPGVAFATLLGSLVHVLVKPWLVARQLSISVFSYYRTVFVRPMALGILLGAAAITLRSISTPDSWLLLVTHGAIAGTLAAMLIYVIGLDHHQRRQVNERVFQYLSGAVPSRARK